MVAARSDAEATRRAISAVQGQLSDLPVALRVEWLESLPLDLRSQVQEARLLAAHRKAIAVFWADLSTPDQVFLYLAHPSGERILVRNIGTESGGDEGRLETFAFIVRTAVKAVLEGGEIGIEPPPEPEPAPEPESRLDLLEATVSYFGAPIADEDVWIHGPRLGISVGFAEIVRLVVAYRFALPVQVDSEYLSLELTPHTFEVGLALRFELRSWSLDTGAVATIDWVTIDVQPSSAAFHTSPAGNQIIAGATPYVQVGWMANRVLAIYFAFALDTVFNQAEYVVESADGQRTVVAPWSVRPFLQLGAAFGIL